MTALAKRHQGKYSHHHTGMVFVIAGYREANTVQFNHLNFTVKVRRNS